jgi:hypothetical protein
MGGWIIELPDGKRAVATNPSTLGKFIEGWATKE